MTDHSTTNGHIPRQAPVASPTRGLILLSALLAAGIAVSVLNHYELKYVRQLNEEVIRGFLDEERSLEADAPHGRPRVWIEGKRVSIIIITVAKRVFLMSSVSHSQLETGYLKHVMEIFDRLGYVRVNGTEDEWDVLWSHDYPFSSIITHQLQPHQRVCHACISYSVSHASS
jgi:hypothetical protein